MEGWIGPGRRGLGTANRKREPQPEPELELDTFGMSQGLRPARRRLWAGGGLLLHRRQKSFLFRRVLMEEKPSAA